MSSRAPAQEEVTDPSPSTRSYVYDFDSVATRDAALGPSVVQYLLSTLSSPTHLDVIVRDPAGKTFEDVSREIVGEKAWGAVVVNANATSNFRSAMAGHWRIDRWRVGSVGGHQLGRRRGEVV